MSARAEVQALHLDLASRRFRSPSGAGALLAGCGSPSAAGGRAAPRRARTRSPVSGPLLAGRGSSSATGGRATPRRARTPRSVSGLLLAGRGLPSSAPGIILPRAHSDRPHTPGILDMDLQTKAIAHIAKSNNELPEGLFESLNSLPGFDELHISMYYAHLVANPRIAQAFYKMPDSSKLNCLKMFISEKFPGQ